MNEPDGFFRRRSGAPPATSTRRAPALGAMPAPVGSADELLALAEAIEQRAARRYRDLAERMRARGDARLARLFEFLAGIEDRHIAHIASRRTPGEAAAGQPGAELPETFDAEAADSRLLTPYRALALAVEGEDRAFAFYAYLAAEAPTANVRLMAEALATEELAHAGLLRRERRKAYRSEQPGSRGPEAEAPLQDLWRACLDLETEAASYHRALAARLAGRADLAAAFAAAAQDEEACARQAAARTGVQPARPAEAANPTVEGGLRQIEAAFERYADIASRTSEEREMLDAQELAARVVRRLQQVQFSITRTSFSGK